MERWESVHSAEGSEHDEPGAEAAFRVGGFFVVGSFGGVGFVFCIGGICVRWERSGFDVVPGG